MPKPRGESAVAAPSRAGEPGAGPRIVPLYTAGQIAGRVEALAGEIAGALPADPVIVAVLKGSFVFAADLMRALDAHGARPALGFVQLASYGASTESSGTVELVGDLTDDVAGRTVLLLDDVLDAGYTLAYAKNLMLGRGAADVRVCVLLDKPSRHRVDLRPDFVGFTVGNVFVVGYGIDYAGRYRHLPYVGYLEPEPEA